MANRLEVVLLPCIALKKKKCDSNTLGGLCDMNLRAVGAIVMAVDAWILKDTA